MQDWETYKRAALEYSRMRPRRVLATITLTADTKAQTAPAACLDIQSLAWGDRAEVGEVYLDDVGTVQAWAFEPGTFLVTPAPTADDTLTVNIIYLAQHVGLWLDAPSLSRALNRPLSQVDSALRELADEGLVETTGRDAQTPRFTMQPGEPTTRVVQRLVEAAQHSQELRRLIVARVAA